MVRRKLPPYGKALKAMRDQGIHPRRAWVIYGGKWDWPIKTCPVLYIPPPYTPETYDFTDLAGICTHVADNWGRDLSVFRLTADIAAEGLGTLVTVHFTAYQDDDLYKAGQQYQADVSEAMYAMRKGGKWPDGWSTAADTDYWDRIEMYLDALEGEVGDESDVA